MYIRLGWLIASVFHVPMLYLTNWDQKNACERLLPLGWLLIPILPSELALRRYLLKILMGCRAVLSNTQTWTVVHLNPSGLCNVSKAVEEFSTPKHIEHYDKSNTQTWTVVHFNPSGLCNISKAVEEFSTPKHIEHNDKSNTMDSCTFQFFGIVHISNAIEEFCTLKHIEHLFILTNVALLLTTI